MTPLCVLEIVCSLSLQVTIIVVTTGWLARYVCRSDRGRDQLWAGGLLAILLVCLGDLCLPHLRLLPVPATLIDPALGLVIAQCGLRRRLARRAMAAGALFMLGRLVVGSLARRMAAATSHRDLPQRLAGTVGRARRRARGPAKAAGRGGDSLSGDDRNPQPFLLAAAPADDRAARNGACRFPPTKLRP